eukprot:scaffold10364_cov61-Attheya_sp.AAC.10
MPTVAAEPGAGGRRAGAGNPKRGAPHQQQDGEEALLPAAKKARDDDNNEEEEEMNVAAVEADVANGLHSESSPLLTATPEGEEAPPPFASPLPLTLPLTLTLTLLTPSKQKPKTSFTKQNNKQEDEDAPSDQPSDFAGGTEAWNAMLFQLILFKTRHSHVNVRHDDSDHRSLYQWVQTQRRHYKLYYNNNNATPSSSSTVPTDTVDQNKDPPAPNNSNKNSGFLTEDRIAVLHALHFRWNIRGEQNWKRNYDDLVLFKAANGHCLVPRLYGDNLRLGEWVTEQRRQYKALCPDDTSVDATTPTKKESTVELDVVVDEDNNPLVLEEEEVIEQQEDVSNKPMTPSNSKKVALSLLTPDRIGLLNVVGFVWKVRDRTNWDFRYQQLLDFKGQNDGSVNVPQHYAANKSLGKWVAKQREQYRLKALGKHSFLNAERIELLNQVGFVWAIKGTRSKAALLRAANKDFPMPTTTTTTATTTTESATTTTDADADVAAAEVAAEETTNTTEESSTAEDQQQLPIFPSMDVLPEPTTDAIETDPVAAEGGIIIYTI